MTENFDFYHSWRYVIWGFALLIAEMVIWELIALHHSRKKKRISELKLVWDTLITDEGADEGLDSFLIIMNGVNQHRISTRLLSSKEYPSGCPDLDACRMVAINAIDRAIVHIKHVFSIDSRNLNSTELEHVRIKLQSKEKYLRNQQTALKALAL